MSLALVHSRAQIGVAAPEVIVEVHLSGGLPSTSIVGLPEAAVRESRDRVRAALITSGFDYPQRKVTISLAPADLPKDGSRFDLAIALGILAASNQLPTASIANKEFLGELALSGEIRAVSGTLPAALQAAQSGRELIVPHASVHEASLADGTLVNSAGSLLEICAYLRGASQLSDPPPAPILEVPSIPDLSDVRGQPLARRALEIAAAGQHNLLFIGPPGTGKTMLATRLAGILPPLTQVEALETAAVASVSGYGLDIARFRERPTRAPHHSASAVALVGGGSIPRPGEISLAHNGVLFLDELPEFDRHVLEVLREPMESGRILISRAARQAEFPARFQLVAAMNPCPCGYHGDPSGRCHCTGDQIARYRSRISGPMLDRIDLHVEVPRLPRSALQATNLEEPSAVVRDRVIAARRLQLARSGIANAQLGTREIERYCAVGKSAAELLDRAIDRLGLSARAYHRILRVSRTLADLEGASHISTPHLLEAIGLRKFDRRLEPAA